mgnify:CR=1 FL=1
MPSSHSAYQEASRFADYPSQHSWSHAAVYLAGRETGWFELRSEKESDLFPRFCYHYDLISRRVRAGEQFEQPHPIAIEQKSEVTHATTMLAFAKTHNIDESEACKVLYYLTLPKGSKVRERQYHQSQLIAAQKGWQLPE